MRLLIPKEYFQYKHNHYLLQNKWNSFLSLSPRRIIMWPGYNEVFHICSNHCNIEGKHNIYIPESTAHPVPAPASHFPQSQK